MPLSLSKIDPTALARVKVIVTDIDDTFTRGGFLAADGLNVLDELDAAGVAVVPVTGRPAGFLLALLTYIRTFCFGVAENGGVEVDRTGARCRGAAAACADLRARLHGALAQVQKAIPRLRITADAFTRMADLTFEKADLSGAELARVATIAAGAGVGASWSSIHVHLHVIGCDKGEATAELLGRRLPECGPDQVVTIGDSHTDEPLFDARRFPLSVGVANLAKVIPEMTHSPRWIADGPELDGFTQLARAVLTARGGVDR